MLGKIKSRLAVIALAAMVLTLLTQGTLAFYTTVGTSTNVVTSGNIKLMIHETTDQGTTFPTDGVFVIPGDIVSKVVAIENYCTHPFYLRVKLVDGIDSAELTSEECFAININEQKWHLGEDGWLYYVDILQPGEFSEPVFTEVEIVGAKVDKSYIGKTLTLTVSAQAVQSENNPADFPWEAYGWPAESGGGA